MYSPICQYRPTSSVLTAWKARWRAVSMRLTTSANVSSGTTAAARERVPTRLVLTLQLPLAFSRSSLWSPTRAPQRSVQTSKAVRDRDLERRARLLSASYLLDLLAATLSPKPFMAANRASRSVVR